MNQDDLLLGSLLEEREFSLDRDIVPSDINPEYNDLVSGYIEKYGVSDIPTPETGVTSIDYIAAFKGDDSVYVSLESGLGCYVLATTNTLLSVKTSWKDTGISSAMYNYAEEWMLLPLTQGTTYRDSDQFGGNMPWVLDVPKLKMLSPVRKQSQMEDDLESKLSFIGTAAKWCNKDWPTYNMHQLAIIMAFELFDFDSCECFPFLEKEDGGLGIPLPWDSVTTGEMYLHHFKRGRCKTAVRSIMAESVALMTNRIEPKDCLVLKTIAAHKAGDETWKRYVAYHKTLKDSPLTEIEIEDLIKSSIGIQLPDELDKEATVVNITSTALAYAVSNLRKKGLIMTELDIAVYRHAQEKYDNIFSQKPFWELYKEQAEELDKLKKRPLQVLETIAKGVNTQESEYLPTVNADVYDLIGAYKRLKRNYAEKETSFSHSGFVRVFNPVAVRDYYAGKNHSDFMKSIGLKPSHVPSRQDYISVHYEEQEKWKAIKEWLQRPNPFEGEIPIGVIPDDLRIACNITRAPSNSHIIIVSNDKQLGKTCRSIVKFSNEKNNRNYSFARMKVDDYLSICAQIADRKPSPEGSFKIYNIFTMSETFLGQKIQLAMQKASSWRKKQVIKPFHFEYDLPNIIRSNQLIRRHNATVIVENSGFITKKLLEDLKSQKQYIALLEIGKIRGLLMSVQRRTISYHDPKLVDMA